MEKEKIIKNLIKIAEEVGKVDIKPENITEMPLEGFYEAIGKVYYNNDTFYRKSPSGWLKTRISPILTDNSAIEKRIKALETWKLQVDRTILDIIEKIKEFNVLHEETIKEFKEYIDNLIKT